MNLQPQISIYLDTRRIKANGKFPVKLKVYTTKRKYYSTVFNLTEDEFKSVYLTTRPRKENKELRKKLIALETRAVEVAENLKPFTFEEFERKLYRKQGSGSNINYHYQCKIDELNKREQVGSSSNYGLSRKSIITFIQDGIKAETKEKAREKAEAKFQKLIFSDVTVDWLRDYERFMTVKNGRSVATVGIYLRSLRALFNNAIELKDIDKDIYPFGKLRYRIPASKNTKKALTKIELKALFHAKPQNEFQQKAKDFWFFSYTCNGMNIKDIAELKHTDVDIDKFVFYRAKTLMTSKTNLKPITVYLDSFSKEVIKKYGKGTKYVFDIINDNLTAVEKKKKVQNFTRFINQHLKALCKANSLPENITTYWARHSFASNYVNNGASVVDAMQSLGHANITTTQNYLKSLEDKGSISNTMMDFD